MRKYLRKRPSPSMAIALLALFIALSGTTYAATGGNFILGQPNSANSVTALTANNAGKALNVTQQNTGAGATALGLNVPAGKPPFAVNSGTKVANLNADKIDNLDSSVFARKASEPWHEVGAAGQPPFVCVFGCFANFGSPHNTAGFYKDSLGIVHLKGLVKWTGSTTLAGTCDGWIVFFLPTGYQPAAREIHPSLENGNVVVSRIDIDPDGSVFLCPSSDIAMGDWFVLDGISFRAAG
jgi:hypothetical protein